MLVSLIMRERGGGRTGWEGDVDAGADTTLGACNAADLTDSNWQAVIKTGTTNPLAPPLDPVSRLSRPASPASHALTD